MTKIDSLIFLVHSMTKSEKRVFKTGRKNLDYVLLFDMICKKEIISAQELKEQYEEQIGKSSFNVAVAYLYKELLNVLQSLGLHQDRDFMFLDQLMKVRILFEKSLFEDALELIDEIKSDAIQYENQMAFLYASRMELEYLLFLNMPHITEEDLVKKHSQINEALKRNRAIFEHLSLYELMMHRTIYKGNIPSEAEKGRLNDLVFTEMSLSSSGKSCFEERKLHQLFQASYLMSVGDQKSASQSLHELNKLFEANPQFWANPPYYYVSALSGILENLRSMRYYDKMPYYISKLNNIKESSERFQIHVSTIAFLYNLFPFIDNGYFVEAKKFIDSKGGFILSKKEQMDIFERAKIMLYLAITYIGTGDYKLAKKTLTYEAIWDKKIYKFPISRIIRLISMIIYYELNDMEYVQMKCRSLKREILQIKKSYKIELLMIDFLRSDKWKLATSNGRKKVWDKMKIRLEDIREDIFEQQILRCFDFTAWIEAKVTKRSLSEVLKAYKILT